MNTPAASNEPTTAGAALPARTEAEAAAEAARLLAEAYSTTAPVATHYRDITPVPAQGDAVPHPQPGRPPMSQRATDHATLVLVYSIGSLPVSGAASLLLWTLSSVSPVALAIIAATPPVCLAAFGIAAKLVSGAVAEGAAALPPTIHHHHTGPTTVQNVHVENDTRWFGKTTNQLPQ
ncbi:hypothetical protein [Streptomyces harbinensis]|uniref:hypothetical protein n=1 Tax=Streptomyces harbinensis TaxID=1176198 RepID=UPI0034DF2E59